MILDRLMRAYKRGAPKPCFGSKFVSFVAKLTIGTARQRDLESVTPELQASYYYRQADRKPPKGADKAKLDRWFNDSQRVSDVRVSEEPVVAKAAGLAAIVVSMVLIAGSASFTWGFQKMFDKTPGVAVDESLAKAKAFVGATVAKVTCPFLTDDLDEYQKHAETIGMANLSAADFAKGRELLEEKDACEARGYKFNDNQER